MNHDGCDMQVLICTFGNEGMRRLAEVGVFPQVDGIRYLVSWQLPDGDADVPSEIAQRSDFNVYKISTRGLSANRNNALDLATAPICLIADDDLHYDADALQALLAAFRIHPNTDVITCHITIDGKKRDTWHPFIFDLEKAPRTYYYSSVEISFRLDAVRQSGVRFNELMGIGAPLLRSGEEEVFMLSLLKKGLHGICLPIILCDHPGSSTGDTFGSEPWFVMVQGALLRFKMRHSWMLALSWRAIVATRRNGRSVWDNMQLLWQGAMYSKRNNMFDNDR